MVELIEVPFRLRTLKEVYIRWASDAHAKGQFLRERTCPGHARQQSVVNCAKMAEPTEMLFGLWTRVS